MRLGVTKAEVVTSGVISEGASSMSQPMMPGKAKDNGVRIPMSMCCFFSVSKFFLRSAVPDFNSQLSLLQLMERQQGWKGLSLRRFYFVVGCQGQTSE